VKEIKKLGKKERRLVVNKRVTKIGWIVLAALLCLSLVLVPGCTTPAEQEEEEEELCSSYIGSGKLDGEGIPLDFFSDLNVRIGCCYAFDYDTYIKDALSDQGAQRGSSVIPGQHPAAGMADYPG